MQIRLRYFIASMAAATVIGGAATGGFIYRTEFGPLHQSQAAMAQADLTKASSVYAMLQKGYYKAVDPQTVVNGAIDGMLKSLNDPYSVYMPPVDSKSFQETLSSSFEGIGAEINEVNGHIVVTSPIHGSPSEKAGLKPNDIIAAANGTSLAGMKATDAVKLIRGPKGTTVKLTIQRPGMDTPFDVTITRDTIPLETVSSKLVNGQIGLIRIDQESERTAEELQSALQQMKSQGAKGLILDLRGNPGGLLNVAVDMAQNFVPNGKTIVSIRYRDGKEEVYRSKGHASDVPVVVLVDKGSASAAEILAGALQESAGVKLIGDTTFGKGVVQTTVDLGDGSLVKYTEAEWLTPAGHQIHKVGIKPDFAVQLPDYAGLPYLSVDKEYKPGEYAPAVEMAQKMLKALGNDPGRVDGYVDAATSQALKTFQAANGLPQSGTLTPVTGDKIDAMLQQKVDQNDTQLTKAEDVLQGMMK